jgi:cytidylate kinase
MAMRIVTIAHSEGAAGDSIGRGVAERLGFRYVDEQIIDDVAKRHGLDADLVADAERRRGFLTRFLEDLGRVPVVDLAGAPGMLPLETTVPRRDELQAFIIDAIRQTAEAGDVVIASHAAGIPLKDRDDVLRVLVTASFDARVSRVAARWSISKAEAEKWLKDSDAGRAAYFRRFHGVERELPTHYDLVINTDRITPEQAIDIVLGTAECLAPPRS